MSSSKTRFDFSGQTVVVTGGSRGIGRQICESFGAAGARVHTCSRRKVDVPFEQTSIESEIVDVRDPEATEAWLERCASASGGIDVLVNNAGASLAAQDEWRPEVFERAVRIALFGSFRLAIAFKDRLAKSRIEGGGSVLNMASMAAFRAVPIVPGYGAAKAAIVQMTKNMGAAWALENVRVNAVAPGFIDGEWLAKGLGKAYEPIKQAMEGKSPLGRVVTPDDVAEAILSLVRGSDLVTGHILPIEGGVLIGS